jgi:hypothetical protein
MFGTKRGEVAGGWRRLHNEEFHNLYNLPHTFRVIKFRRMHPAGRVAITAYTRNVYGILFREREGKRAVARPRRRWEDNT